MLEDSDLGGGKRWVRIGAAGGGGLSILLARAVTPAQVASVGHQTGGRVFIFVETDDVEGDVRRFRERGVRILREPGTEPFGRVAVVEDLCGNKIDLIQRGSLARLPQ